VRLEWIAVLFTSPAFLFAFLPIALALFYASGRLFGKAASIPILTLLSLGFYAWWNPWFLLVLVPSIGGNFVIGRRIHAARAAAKASKRWMIAGVAANLTVLVFFKYAAFLADSVLAVVGQGRSGLQVPLPLGISFFTFTQIAYLVDVWRAKATEVGIDRYGLFVTYFPHLIAGPIIHHAEMMPQFGDDRTYRFHRRHVAIGLAFFVAGLFKKVVMADGVAPLANSIFEAYAHGQTLSASATWLGALAYTAQLYFDFSGYSDMAIGLSRMMNIKLPFNFDSPYQSTSIVEFWRRWHMTLSRFLRDYLYFSLGGNRRGELRRYVNLFLTMLLGGLWHGAGWSFVIWGGLHGAYLTVNHLWRRFRGGGEGAAEPIPRVLSWALTFACVVVAWVFFRADTSATAVHMLAAMLAVGRSADATTAISTPDVLWVAVLLAWAFVLPNTQQVIDGGYLRPLGLARKPWLHVGWTSFATGFLISWCLLITMITISKSGLSEFLYFNF
jgi:D-alanyl-lipoteichoic acid acyltransferase DltB (MBOAT superfamily)